MAIRARPLRILVAALLAALLAAGVIMFLTVRGAADGHVYAVAELRQALAQDPSAWRGRLVRVRGVALAPIGGPACYAFSPCSRATYAALWPDADALQAEGMMAVSAPLPANIPLFVTLGGPDDLLAFLRKVPLLRALLPPQGVRWGVPATYRVRLSTTLDVCAVPPCVSGTLLDAGAAPAPEGMFWSARTTFETR